MGVDDAPQGAPFKARKEIGLGLHRVRDKARSFESDQRFT